jgi:hypothetical protein
VVEPVSLDHSDPAKTGLLVGEDRHLIRQRRVDRDAVVPALPGEVGGQRLDRLRAEAAPAAGRVDE